MFQPVISRWVESSQQEACCSCDTGIIIIIPLILQRLLCRKHSRTGCTRHWHKTLGTGALQGVAECTRVRVVGASDGLHTAGAGRSVARHRRGRQRRAIRRPRTGVPRRPRLRRCAQRDLRQPDPEFHLARPRRGGTVPRCVRARGDGGRILLVPCFLPQVSGALRHPCQAIPLFPSGLIRNQTKPSERLVRWARASEALASKRMRDLCLRALFKACLGRGWCERRRRQAQSTPSVVHACMRTA